jgi:putative ABC transport system permease protein
VLVFGLIALVLVVACTNLANLVLARGTMRQQEFAVRRALGASRWRLVREQSSESLLLAIGGGLSAWILMQVLINTFDFEVPLGKAWMTVSAQPEISAGALAVSAGALLLSLVVFGLEPALQLTRTEVRADLAAGSGSVGVPKAKRQRTLLRWQVAISAGFFIIATLSVRYLVAESRHDSGVDLDRIAVAPIDFYLQRVDEDRARRTAQQIVDAVREQPGVDGVTVSTGMPFGSQMNPRLLVSTTDKSITASPDQEGTSLVAATPDYFRVTGIAILRGRGFDDRDDAGAPPAVVLSESIALKLLGSSDVVGRQLLIKVDTVFRGVGVEQPTRTATIVGVAEDTDRGNFPGRRGEMAYMPLAQAYSPWMTVVARAKDAATATAALRAGIRQAVPDLGVESIAGGRTTLGGPFVFLRTAGLIAVSLGALTLLLAMVGLYGVQSHIVAHRTREIGVRMSLGATAAQVRAMVLKDGYKPVLQGLGIGLFIGIAGRAIVRSYIAVEVAVFDPWMLLLVPIPLLLAAFFACFLPARRASRVDPNVALRHL